MPEKEIILHTENISKSFDNNKNKLVIAGINLTVQAHEIVTFLGMSGTGKSTFLRIIAGLSTPNSGTVTCCGELITQPSKHISMVFQNFALLPWLNVFDNVAFGLEAMGVPQHAVMQRTKFMMKIIGLSGYENVSPKELSGGMKQRVGFARALAIEPSLLLLDEPFSALDIYTSQKIRNNLLSLWSDQLIKTQSIILVTHNVEEAVMMSDRILVWGSNPGNIQYEFKMDMPWQQRTKRNTLDKLEEISQIMHQQITISESHGRRRSRISS